jgi:hypothetical protein
MLLRLRPTHFEQRIGQGIVDAAVVVSLPLFGGPRQSGRRQLRRHVFCAEIAVDWSLLPWELHSCLIQVAMTNQYAGIGVGNLTHYSGSFSTRT